MKLAERIYDKVLDSMYEKDGFAQFFDGMPHKERERFSDDVVREIEMALALSGAVVIKNVNDVEF